MRGLAYMIETIILILLLFSFIFFTFPSIQKYSNALEKRLFLKSFTYSLLFDDINKMLDNFKLDELYILIDKSFEGRVKKYYFLIDYYEPAYLNFNGNCGFFFFPLPSGSEKFGLWIIKNDQDCDFFIRRDWYILFLSINKSLISNISLDLNFANKTLDKNSLFLFDIKGNPLKIIKFSFSNNTLNISAYTFYSDYVYLILRLKNPDEEDLNIDREYKKVNFINGIKYNYSYSLFSWITVGTSCNGSVIIRLSYPYVKEYKTGNFSNCTPAKFYIAQKLFTYFPDISLLMKLPEKTGIVSYIYYPGLYVKRLTIYGS